MQKENITLFSERNLSEELLEIGNIRNKNAKKNIIVHEFADINNYKIKKYV